MDNKPLVSIIIPSYNHQKYIVDALNSVINERYPNKEILIIDDGSKDDSVKIIEDWISLNKQFPIYFSARENKGLCATLNELVEKARGKYIVILASDDILCNNTLVERVEFLENTPNKLVLIADAEGIDENGKTIYNSIMSDFHSAKKANYFSDDEILNEITFRFSISGAVVIANREIYKLIGPYPEDLKAEDLYFYLRAACLKKIAFKDRIVSQYRIHSENTSGFNPALTTAVIKTYLQTITRIPGFLRKLKVLKRIVGLYIYSFKINH